MNILIEWIFWIFIKWIISLTLFIVTISLSQLFDFEVLNFFKSIPIFQLFFNMCCLFICLWEHSGMHFFPHPHLALFDTASFKKMNILFEWIFMILKKWIIFLNEYSGFWKNEYFVWMNILDYKKMNILFEWIFWILKKWIFCLNEYSGF